MNFRNFSRPSMHSNLKVNAATIITSTISLFDFSNKPNTRSTVKNCGFAKNENYQFDCLHSVEID